MMSSHPVRTWYRSLKSWLCYGLQKLKVSLCHLNNKEWFRQHYPLCYLKKKEWFRQHYLFQALHCYFHPIVTLNFHLMLFLSLFSIFYTLFLHIFTGFVPLKLFWLAQHAHKNYQYRVVSPRHFSIVFRILFLIVGVVDFKITAYSLNSRARLHKSTSYLALLFFYHLNLYSWSFCSQIPLLHLHA